MLRVMFILIVLAAASGPAALPDAASCSLRFSGARSPRLKRKVGLAPNHNQTSIQAVH